MIFSSCLMNFCHLIRHLMITSNCLKSYSMNPQRLNFSCCFRYLKHLIVYRLKPCLMNFQCLNSFGYCLMTSIDCCLHCLKYLIAYCLKFYLMIFQRLNSFGYCCLMTSIGCLRYLKYLIACCLKPYLTNFQHLNFSYCYWKYLIACCLKLYLTSFQCLSSFGCLMTSIDCLYYLKHLMSF